ncbi:TM2 domain-containing protein [Amycolatopsis marina]|uniref:TM2 domain-containing protein n=1 Tax=Amycolatopsis marina TaxID=490629 RepID=A0A1I0ZCZ3_9PSEU|nr:DUF1707 domain-containing protein [Amycolatopsis marina]SFB23495.1 TM2 domain-containing protein [Amycolatopsis marina]
MSSPLDPESLRVGTSEREEAGRVLGDHFAEGRLSTDEYESRVAAAFEAKNRADLRALFLDLPAPLPSFLRPPAAPTPPQPRYAAPPAYRPAAQVPVTTSDKSKIVAGVLQIVLPFGVGRFYTGHAKMAVAQLLVTLVTFGLGALWPLIDGILLLVNGGQDGHGRQLSD